MTRQIVLKDALLTALLIYLVTTEMFKVII